jgi:hypothetical protein
MQDRCKILGSQEGRRHWFEDLLTITYICVSSSDLRLQIFEAIINAFIWIVSKYKSKFTEFGSWFHLLNLYLRNSYKYILNSQNRMYGVCSEHGHLCYRYETIECGAVSRGKESQRALLTVPTKHIVCKHFKNFPPGYPSYENHTEGSQVRGGYIGFSNIKIRMG